MYGMPAIIVASTAASFFSFARSTHMKSTLKRGIFSFAAGAMVFISVTALATSACLKSWTNQIMAGKIIISSRNSALARLGRETPYFNPMSFPPPGDYQYQPPQQYAPPPVSGIPSGGPPPTRSLIPQHPPQHTQVPPQETESQMPPATPHEHPYSSRRQMPAVTPTPPPDFTYQPRTLPIPGYPSWPVGGHPAGGHPAGSPPPGAYGSQTGYPIHPAHNYGGWQPPTDPSRHYQVPQWQPPYHSPSPPGHSYSPPPPPAYNPYPPQQQSYQPYQQRPPNYPPPTPYAREQYSPTPYRGQSTYSQPPQFQPEQQPPQWTPPTPKTKNSSDNAAPAYLAVERNAVDAADAVEPENVATEIPEIPETVTKEDEQ